MADRSVQRTFKSETIQEIFQSVWVDRETKITKDAMTVSAEFLRLFTVEAIKRAAQEASEEDSMSRPLTSEGEGRTRAPRRLEAEYLERIAPQLILDF